MIDARRRYGDWEGDTVVGKGNRSGCLTLVERKSGYVRLARLNDRRAATTARAANRMLRPLPADLRRSVTFDNGKEFAHHRRLTERVGIDVYFARPGKPWERGSNENLNGLLRQYVPKGTPLDRLSRRAVARIERQLNERPRRRLGYRTPAEVLQKRLVAFGD